MNVTIYRVSSGAEDFVAVDEQKAKSVAAADQNASMWSRDFVIPDGWAIYDVDDEEVLFDVERNPYNVTLNGAAPTTPEKADQFNVTAVPIFQGENVVLEPAK